MAKQNRTYVASLLFPALLLLLPTAHAQAVAAASDKDPVLPVGLAKEFLDTTVDPCTDFAKYACGNFAKLNPIPADMPSYGSGAMVYNHTQFALHGLLEKVSADNASRTPNEQKIGDFYASCMDTKKIEADGLKALQPELDRISSLKSKSDLISLLAHFQLINVNTFMSYGEQQDFKDAQKQIAVVDQGGLGLPERDYYLRSGDAAEKTRQQYVEHITNMLKLLGQSPDSAAADAQNIMQLETALAKISMDVTSQRDPKNVYHLMPVSQLEALTPFIPWSSFFEQTGTPAFTQLNVANPDFFKGLQTLLTSTSHTTLQAYLRWQLINSTPSYTLPTSLDDEHFNFFSRTLRGQPQQRARWKRCSQATDGALGEALGEVYVKAYFTAEEKQRTLQMVHDIEAAMDKNIDSLTWMSAPTKVKAKEKLHLIADKIGYPDHWRDYSTLKIVRGDAYGNALRSYEFENHRQLTKIGKPVDRSEWITTPSTVDAFYNPSMNDINFPAGILQSPLYDPKATDAENYGHVGGIVGHELTHGFDDQGRQFDGHGNLSDWWTAEDATKFTAMTDCEVKEYSDFTAVDDVKINGKLTLGENTADNGGLRLAYMAMLADAKRKGIDVDAKDATGYTPVQQFFLAHGQNWCGETRPESTRLMVQTDPPLSS